MHDHERAPHGGYTANNFAGGANIAQQPHGVPPTTRPRPTTTTGLQGALRTAKLYLLRCRHSRLRDVRAEIVALIVQHSLVAAWRQQAKGRVSIFEI